MVVKALSVQLAMADHSLCDKACRVTFHVISVTTQLVRKVRLRCKVVTGTHWYSKLVIVIEDPLCGHTS